MSEPLTKEGLHPSVSWDEYIRIPAINMSLLQNADFSMAHLHHAITAPGEKTHALNVGTATHWALFEPEKFKQMCVKMDGDGRKKEFKDAKNAAEAEGKVVLKSRGYTTPGGSRVLGYDDIIAMRDAARSKSMIKTVLDAPGYAECTIIWKDGPTGILCKGRLDRFVECQGESFVTDLKTTKCAKSRIFGYDIRKWHYHIKAAWYLDGLYALSAEERRWLWLCVEKKPPYECAVYEPDDDMLERGRSIYQRWMARYAKAVDDDCWPGYPDGIEPIEMPDQVKIKGEQTWVS